MSAPSRRARRAANRPAPRRQWRTLLECVCDADEYRADPGRADPLRRAVTVDPRNDPPTVHAGPLLLGGPR
jgi:hypothetical protein